MIQREISSDQLFISFSLLLFFSITMKKALPFLALLVLLAGCSSKAPTPPTEPDPTKSVQTQTGLTKSTQEVNSPYEGYTLREGKIVSYNLLDRGQFDDSEAGDTLYEECKKDKDSRGTEKCPIFSIISFEPIDGTMEDEWYPTGVELFESLDDEEKSVLDLGCYSPENEEGPAIIYTSSYDKTKGEDDNYSIMDEATEEALINLVDTDKTVKLKLTKTPYHVDPAHVWAGCESIVNKVEIVK